MAWVKKLETVGGEPRYKVYWYDPSGRQRSKNFRRFEEARRFQREVETSKDRGTYIDPAAGRTTLEEWVSRWRATAVHLRPSSRERVEITLRRDILPRLGARPLASIGAADVQALVAELVAEGKAPATVRKTYNVLSGILRAAVREGLIARSPAVGIQLPQLPRTEMRFLTAEEVARLAQEAAPYEAAVLLAAWGGLRFGELAGLRVEQVDFLRSRITVDGSIVEVAGRLHAGPTKTARVRSIHLPRFVTEAVAAHLARHPAGPEGFVFRSPEGGPLRRSNFMHRVFEPAVARAGLEPLRFHDLRHTAAALAIAAGAHPKAIQERLGHASITTTLDRYGHLFEGLDEGLARRMEELYGVRAVGGIDKV